jgi:hypothetical protein
MCRCGNTISSNPPSRNTAGERRSGIDVAVAGVAIFLAAAVPTVAGAPERYVNARFGYSIDIPAAIAGSRTDSENGDGATFHAKDGSAELRVWGSFLTDGGFADAVKERAALEEAGGWLITYRKSAGVRWAVYSGNKGDRIFYARAIPACAGDATAYFRLEYPKASTSKYDAALHMLNGSLAAGKDNCP